MGIFKQGKVKYIKFIQSIHAALRNFENKYCLTKASPRG